MPDNRLPLLPLLLDGVPPGLEQMLAQEGVPFRHRAEDPLAGRFVLFDSRRGPVRPAAGGQRVIDITSLRPGERTDPFDAMLDQHSARHQWQIAGLTVCEEIARVDRRAVRQRVLGRLRELVEQGGGVWLRLCAFPFPYRSALSFRIDYDEFDLADFNATHEAISGMEHATSHFVNAAAYLPHSNVLGRFKGLEIGSHGFRHHTYRTKQENLENIRRGIESLEAFGLEPAGFAAPHGRYNRGLGEAMEALGITHSSEFALAYDDLPFWPDRSKVLQVPIHPVSLGIFLEAVQGEGARRNAATQQAVRAAVDHFRQTARAKYHAGEPVFFYGHPTRRLGRYPQLLRAVFDTAGAFGAIWPTTLGRFAQWWRVRSRVRLSVSSDHGRYVVAVHHLPKDYRLAVEYWRGRHVARIPLEGRRLRFSPAALAYENRQPRCGVHPVRIDRPEGIGGRFRRMIDWEHVTPIEEISKGDWRNWTKRILRSCLETRH